jgi:hypothetical protein
MGYSCDALLFSLAHPFGNSFSAGASVAATGHNGKRELQPPKGA